MKSKDGIEMDSPFETPEERAETERLQALMSIAVEKYGREVIWGSLKEQMKRCQIKVITLSCVRCGSLRDSTPEQMSEAMESLIRDNAKTPTLMVCSQCKEPSAMLPVWGETPNGGRTL